MSVTDVLSVGAILVSVLTFVVAIYEQYLKAAKLRLVFGSQLWLSYGHGRSHLGFWASVALSNLGAVDAVVLNMTGTLMGTDGWRAEVCWYSFGDFAAPDRPHGGDPDDKEGAPELVARGWTETMVASSRRATTNWIGFRLPKLPGPLRADVPYTLTLDVKVQDEALSLLSFVFPRDSGQRTAASWAGVFSLSPQDVEQLEGSGEADADARVERLLSVEVTGAGLWFKRQGATAALPGAKQLTRIGADWRP
jgi:hypothetical protein